MIQRWRRVWRRPAADRWLLLRAALLVAAIRLGLWVLPFRTVRSLLARFAPASGGPCESDPSAADKVAWAVATAARCVPAATCLTQALAGQQLLSRRGVPARLHIGVAKAEGQPFAAHAWLESDGRVILGGSGLGRYTPLAVLEKETL